jgi:LPXTG-site transpeptidase (sortase) family protein
MQETAHTPMKYASPLERKVTFFFVAVGVIALTYGFLYLVDFLPEKPDAANDASQMMNGTTTKGSEDASSIAVAHPLPVKIIFDSLDREVPILNPESDDVATLDAALLEGVARHPDSADFENTGTMFLLGHSSHLPIVHNKNFQAFNDIEKLGWGDTIRVQSADTEYVYRVDKVYQAKASDAEVPLQFVMPRLTLVTCNSFGTKEDRYVVEAYLVETRPLEAS